MRLPAPLLPPLFALALAFAAATARADQAASAPAPELASPSASVPVPAAAAGAKAAFTAEDLVRLRRVSDPQVSPDGRRLAARPVDLVDELAEQREVLGATQRVPVRQHTGALGDAQPLRVVHQVGARQDRIG